ncbi:FAD-linked oxidase-like protein, partial [Phycomyces nitens]
MNLSKYINSTLSLADMLYDSMPIIPFSGGTSLEGHFTAPMGGICISFTEHMDKIVAFHPEDMDIVVQPGVSWESLNSTLKEHNMFFPLDPGPGACIGGMVGTACSGTNAVRWGTMREWVLNLTVVLPDGKVMKTRQRPRKSSAGYDLTRLYIGSEGTLGVVTEATLKLAVIPEERSVAVCDFPTIRDAAAVVPDLVQAGVQIGAVELLDDVMMKAVCLADPSLGHAEKPTLFFKFSGSKPQIEHEIKVVSEIVKKHKGGTFKYAKTEKEKEDLWEGRKICLWSATLLKENASVWTTDVVVPVSRLPELIDETKKDLSKSFLPAPVVGHVGDGNFHVFILFDKSKPEEYEEAKRINKALLERAIRMEGSVTGEHGVGAGKKAYLREELGDNTIDLMWTIKNAIDPKDIMNPGKVLPD